MTRWYPDFPKIKPRPKKTLGYRECPFASEAEFQGWLRSLALNQLGLSYYHTHNSKHSQSGYPDTHIVGGTPERPLEIYAELKMPWNPNPKEAQREWLTLLTLLARQTNAAVGYERTEVHLWMPDELDKIRRKLLRMGGIGAPA